MVEEKESGFVTLYLHGKILTLFKVFDRFKGCFLVKSSIIVRTISNISASVFGEFYDKNEGSGLFELFETKGSKFLTFLILYIDFHCLIISGEN